jgi:hypothetical protein
MQSRTYHRGGLTSMLAWLHTSPSLSRDAKLAIQAPTGPHVAREDANPSFVRWCSANVADISQAASSLCPLLLHFQSSSYECMDVALKSMSTMTPPVEQVPSGGSDPDPNAELLSQMRKLLAIAQAATQGTQPAKRSISWQ